MSFFFGKKKGQNAHPDPPRSGAASRDASGSGPSLTAAQVNGAKGRITPVAGAPAIQTPTPGSSVNNSINSVNGAKTPSPDHGRGDGPGQGVSSDREKQRVGGSIDEPGQVRFYKEALVADDCILLSFTFRSVLTTSCAIVWPFSQCD